MNAQDAKQLVKQFDLITAHAQMSIGVLASGHVVALHLGARMPAGTDLAGVIQELGRASYLADTDGIHDLRLEQLPLVYPAFGTPDMRTPAINIRRANGSSVLDLRFQSAQWLTTKPLPDGLPALRAAARMQTLALTLADSKAGVTVTLVISADVAHDTFAQHVVIKNTGTTPLHLTRAMSWSWDLLNDQYDIITQSGAWGREMHTNRRALQPGEQGVNSKRGASGHGQDPFVALASAHTDWQQGQVLGASLVYSGDFSAKAAVDMHQNTRVQVGIAPFDFDWKLVPQNSFTTPEAVIAVTDGGLRELSHIYHRAYTDCLLPKYWAVKPRPVVINNWEATYFDFDREKLLALADHAAAIGVELFVLDDGWFGRRNDDRSSLGDWWPNEAKLGGSLDRLIAEINARGLQFGLWVEPEMVSPDSDLYRAHPDWIIADPDHTPQLARNQYVLDLGQRVVQDYLIKTLVGLLDAHHISYLKWDMNRNLTDVFSQALPASQQGECRHRYILGLYRVLAALTHAHPEVLLEGCAGGGGRFDAGMLAYAPQIWTSDDTDAIARLPIQRGTSLVYPPQAMSCHVSLAPNEQVHRITPLTTRTQVAQMGAFGYELDLGACTTAELAQLKADIAEYKRLRQVLQFGQLDWLVVHDPQNEYAWQKLSDTMLVIDHVNILAQPNTVLKRLRACALPPHTQWRSQASAQVYSAEYLMTIGVAIPQPQGDFVSSRWQFEQVT